MNENLNLMKHKIAYLVFSALILVPGIFFLLFSGLNLSIDFTGGSVFRYQKTDALQEEVIRSTLNTMGIEVESVRID